MSDRGANASELIVADTDAWRKWLDRNESTSDGVWLTLAKKGVNKPTSLSYSQALDEALCSGWIDGQLKGGDATTYLRRFTPRRPGSLWSSRNVAAAQRLIEAGRMRERGTAEIEAARSDRRWRDAYAGSAGIDLPDDLAAALDAEPSARKTFDGLNATNRYSVLYRVTTARSPQTRQRRIDRLVDMLARGDTPNPQKPGD